MRNRLLYFYSRNTHRFIVQYASMNFFILFITLVLQGYASITAAPSQENNEKIFADSSVQVPIGGNTWADKTTGRPRLVTNAGIENWTNAANEFTTYVRISKPGSIKIRLKAKTDGVSQLRLKINGKEKRIRIDKDAFQFYDAGNWKLKDTGYIQIHLSGISKTKDRFAEVSEYEISGTAINSRTAFVKDNDGNFFYWGRRGPSVHLNFPFADSIKAEWFYNEITVPVGQDVIGSYYMANGFAEGYFGIQVNSASERRILFSVWSPFQTADPKSIPEDMRILMLRKAEGVYTGEFGNEGSGGQSYLRYNWRAGNTYKFLLNGCPDQKGNTIYTAFFFAPEKGEWMLIASFQRPKTNTYLRRFHSFLENFIPEQGDKERRALFGNQWIRDTNGNWIELKKAGFTYDNTAAKGFRMDYAGGVENGQFFLKNCGFFNQYTAYRSSFERPGTGKQPEIDFNNALFKN
jgi:hypothetical protein